METKDKATQRKVGETIAEKPSTFDIDIRADSKFHAFLQRLKISPSVKTFKIKPQLVGNIYRIAARAVSLDTGAILMDDVKYELPERINQFLQVIANHGEDIFYIVACVIQNNKREPKKSLITFIKNNFEVEDLLSVLIVGVSNYNLASFTNSIALMTGVKSLNQKASPTEAGV